MNRFRNIIFWYTISSLLVLIIFTKILPTNVLEASTDYETFGKAVPPSGVSKGTGWAIIHGTCDGNILVKDLITYYLTASGQWIEAQSSNNGGLGGGYFDGTKEMLITNNGDGTFTMIANSRDTGGGAGSGHFWLNSKGIFPNDIQGIFVTMDAKGPSSCGMLMGFDWWPDSAPTDFDPAAEGYQAGSSKTRPLTTDWSSYAFSSILLDRLKSNPPPGY